MRACLHSRTAMRVLLELARFPAPDAEALYEGARAIDWEEWLTARTTLAVEASVGSSAITHSGYAALKVKDAAVDALREKLGARPDVDAKDPDVRIVLHLARDEATLSLDLAGEPLHRRGLPRRHDGGAAQGDARRGGARSSAAPIPSCRSSTPSPAPAPSPSSRRSGRGASPPASRARSGSSAGPSTAAARSRRGTG